MPIHYRNLWGYKYQLAVPYVETIPIRSKTTVMVPGR